jgi:hypothetical protein
MHNEPSISIGRLLLSVTPRDLLNPDTASGAIHTTHGTGEKDHEAPEGNEPVKPLLQCVVAGAHLATTRTDAEFPHSDPVDFLIENHPVSSLRPTC